MTKLMLIDAVHPEETRVAVTENNRIVEFDLESITKKQNIGNIYLAKVTRVESSLQAAFVEYGTQRQGFLPFSEIHPDYYQVPYEDRKTITEEMASLGDSDSEFSDSLEEGVNADEIDAVNLEHSEYEEDNSIIDLGEGDNIDNAEKTTEPGEGELEEATSEIENDQENTTSDQNDGSSRNKEKKIPLYKRYNIQEVVRKNQVMLVQVIKDERGNKGAALTSYLSLAGRYCVLMPNTPKGGGVSRKITNIQTRQRLKEIIQSFEIPDGMGLIIRTAGESRTKNEIKRDFEYLMRVWENVRDLTLKSTAPYLVYEEGNIVKRAIRDMYQKDIQKVMVEGEEAYREAKAFMKMLMPSHARHVQLYKEEFPVFAKYKIETQLDSFYSSVVQLKSGGYLVIEQTEALVSIDINSGRANKKHSIEETALLTNLEATEEIARQLRLRDLAGLVVIDFIDMEYYQNNRAIEKNFREALKQDKARIQVGRISGFGLLEMARQRLRPAIQESHSLTCKYCHGTGHVRSVESASLRILRAISEYLMQNNAVELRVLVPTDVMGFILNYKRAMLNAIEEAHNIKVLLETSVQIIFPNYKIQTVRTVADAPRHAVIEEEVVNHNILPEEKEGEDGKKRRSRRRKRFQEQEGQNNIPEKKIEKENNKNTEKGKNRRSAVSRSNDKKRSAFEKRKQFRFKDKEAQKVVLGEVEIIIENHYSVQESLNSTHSAPTQDCVQDMENNLNETIEDKSSETPSVIVEDKQSLLQSNEEIIEEKDQINLKNEHPVDNISQPQEIVEERQSNHVILPKEHIEEDTEEENAIAENADNAESVENASEEPEQPAPARRGWWRRRFGL